MSVWSRSQTFGDLYPHRQRTIMRGREDFYRFQSPRKLQAVELPEQLCHTMVH
jgi:hypothetical protein